MNLSFKMQFLQRIFCYNFNDKIFIDSFFEFSVVYLILFEEVFLGIYIERYFINLNCHIFTPKSKETKCNGLHFIKL